MTTKIRCTWVGPNGFNPLWGRAITGEEKEVEEHIYEHLKALGLVVGGKYEPPPQTEEEITGEGECPYCYQHYKRLEMHVFRCDKGPETPVKEG